MLFFRVGACVSRSVTQRTGFALQATPDTGTVLDLFKQNPPRQIATRRLQKRHNLRHFSEIVPTPSASTTYSVQKFTNTPVCRLISKSMLYNSPAARAVAQAPAQALRSFTIWLIFLLCNLRFLLLKLHSSVTLCLCFSVLIPAPNKLPNKLPQPRMIALFGN